MIHIILVSIISLLVFALQACSDSASGQQINASSSDVHSPLWSKLYSIPDAHLEIFSVNGTNPLEVTHATNMASDLLSTVNSADVSIFSITYSITNLPQISILMRKAENNRLLIYNHGHSGLPCRAPSIHLHNDVECDTADVNSLDFLRQAFDAGFDLLVTSMPQVGLNTPIPNKVYTATAWGSSTPTAIDRDILTGWPSLHTLYELVNDKNHYMHYFIDGVVIPLSVINPSSSQNASNPYLVSTVKFNSKKYTNINYVGLSGGATTGLITCAVEHFRSCILASGVMPEDIRLKYRNSFGEAEQISRSFYENFGVASLIDLIGRNGSYLVLLFNSQDGCCFSDPAATEFKLRNSALDIRVRNSDSHGFDPLSVLSIINR
jgi:hypothetical protein